MENNEPECHTAKHCPTCNWKNMCQRERDRDRQTDRQRGRERERETIPVIGKTEVTERERQTDKQAGRQKERKTDRQTDRHIENE